MNHQSAPAGEFTTGVLVKSVKLDYDINFVPPVGCDPSALILYQPSAEWQRVVVCFRRTADQRYYFSGNIFPAAAMSDPQLYMCSVMTTSRLDLISTTRQLISTEINGNLQAL
jgi:hypothetical protein